MGFSGCFIFLISIISLNLRFVFAFYKSSIGRSWGRVYTNRWGDSKNYFLTEPKWFNALLPTNNTVMLLEDNNSKTISTTIRRLPIFQYDEGVEFPTGRVPLNIFVDKYLKMMTDAYENDKMFGIVCSNGKGKSYEIGTAVEIVHRQILDDGRQFLINACRQRFRILKIIQEEPYMVAEVEYGLVDTDVLQAETSGAGELPSHLCDMEKEVYQTLKDIVTLTNKLVNSKTNTEGVEDLYGDSLPDKQEDIELQVSQTVQLLSPQSHPFRLQVASEFSFAIADIISGLPLYRQLLLESETLELRLLRLKQLLGNARENLLREVSALEEPFS